MNVDAYAYLLSDSALLAKRWSGTEVRVKPNACQDSDEYGQVAC